MSRYAKTIIAVLTTVALAVVQAIQSVYGGKWTTEDTLVVLVAALGSLSVYAVPNKPPAGQPSDPNVSEVDAP